MDTTLDAAVRERGREFFAAIRKEKPGLFDKSWWTGKVLDWAMRHEDFKVRLFRFVDVLPCLKTPESLISHMEEYFVEGGHEMPPALKWGTKVAGTGKLAARMFSSTLRANIEAMADQFIIGKDMAEALESVVKLRSEHYGFTVDILGEATVSTEEEERYQQGYLQLLGGLGDAQQDWRPLGVDEGNEDWGHAPKINIAVKPTTLCSQANPSDFEGSVAMIVERFVPLVAKAKEIGAFLCIDMEQHRYKDITLEVYRRLRSMDRFRDYPHFGVVLQTYLKSCDKDLEIMLSWARAESLAISIRLVKGAYWDYETILAQQNGWPAPVYMKKEETDAAFERLSARILHNHDICHLACASHNIRSIAAVMETARHLKVPDQRYEFQVLYGMAEPVRRALQGIARRVRLYCPFGELLPGMAYLVRRLLENTSNESFLRHTFVEEREIDHLLQDPAGMPGSRHVGPGTTAAASESATAGFRNESAADFTRADVRSAFPAAIAEVRARLGGEYPLVVGDRKIMNSDRLASVNPADPDEIIGHVSLAGPEDIDAAIMTARRSQPGWQDVPAAERAGVLYRAAGIMRQRLFELAAWQVLEVGKQWGQAHADVAEAIDFLEYYGREMLRLAEGSPMISPTGETNRYLYQPRGVSVVIAPWNFPLAISCGMCAAAIVTGNTLVYKPSGLSPVIGAQLAEIFAEAGLPAGIFNFLPVRGAEMGDLLVDHPEVNVIAFTGSVEVGLRIFTRAAVVQSGQRNVKKVIAEMGGKNAIIVDDDADLDEAVVQILHSAFGYQGQKCSACSRVIVLNAVYDKVAHRLVEAARSIRIGPAEDPANFMGPVIDGRARDKIGRYIEIGKKEGTLLLQREMPDKGYYVPLTILGDVGTGHVVAHEEIFGPVLSVMRADSYEQALEIANSAPFALTGGVFSRSPVHLDMARRRFRVGNLYLNRGITGALVGRQPFGGFRMSGIGSKAGGPDYLLQFMEPKTVTENTMRRGFAPIHEEE